MNTYKYILITIIILSSFLAGAYFYPQLPDQMASHWGINGEVNGYMSKFWGAFMLPIILVIIALLLIFIPKIDPMKANILKFKNYFENFIILIVSFMCYIYALTLIYNLGYQINLTLLMIPALSMLFYYTGILVEKAEPNWTIGIRTPWTLSNENVWRKTHQLSGKLFKAAALIGLLGLIFPACAFWFVLLPIITATIYTFIYSYLEYRKEQK